MKRLLNLIVTFAMVLSLVACGNSNESTESSSVSDVTSADSTQDTQEVSTEIKRAIAFGLVPHSCIFSTRSCVSVIVSPLSVRDSLPTTKVYHSVD